MAIKSSDQVSVLDITDGYGSLLTSEAYTLIGDTAHALAATVTTQVMAYRGADAVPINVGTITCPTGITAAITDNNTNTPTITFTVAGGVVASACEAVIPYTVNGEASYTKKFSFAVALKGATGATGNTGATGAPGGKWYTGTAITGTATAGTVFSSSGITAANVGDMYLNTSTSATYICLVGGNAATATWSYQNNIKGSTGNTGPTGTPGGKWYTGTGITGTNTTATIFSGSGVSAANVGDMYLNTDTSNTYLCVVGGAASVATWSYKANIQGDQGIQGVQGNPGMNAIHMVITSSAGTVFKNTSVATTLTAHVYQGGVELDSTAIAALGTIKWYKDGGSTAVGTGATLTITAGDVTNTATYAAQLEG